MILTNSQIFNLYEAIGQLKEINLPIRMSFQLIKNLKLLEPYYTSIQEVRNSVLVKYGYDGTPNFQFAQEKIEDINKELMEILEIENEVAVSQIWMVDLEKALPQAPLTLLEALYPIIGEEV